MAANHVYVFAKAQPSPVSFLAEVRSAVEKGGKTISTMQVKMYHRNPQKTVRLSLSLGQKPLHSDSFSWVMSSEPLCLIFATTSRSGSSSELLESPPIVIFWSTFATILTI